METAEAVIYRWEAEPSVAKTVRRLSYRSCSGWYRSIKCNAQLPFESLLERDLMVVQDIDPNIVVFAHKPETLIWADGRQERRYTPNFRVITRDERVAFRKVMPKLKLTVDPRLQGRLSHITTACVARGATFEIWTKADIRKQPRLANCARIRAAVAFLTPTNCATVRSALPVGQSTTLADLQAAVGSDPVLVGTVLGLVAIGELTLDLDSIIRPETELHPGKIA